MKSVMTRNTAHGQPPLPGITSERCYSTVDKREEYISGFARHVTRVAERLSLRLFIVFLLSKYVADVADCMSAFQVNIR
jgi:hypothetical protein